jgi:hypothetical protein
MILERNIFDRGFPPDVILKFSPAIVGFSRLNRDGGDRRRDIAIRRPKMRNRQRLLSRDADWSVPSSTYCTVQSTVPVHWLTVLYYT